MVPQLVSKKLLSCEPLCMATCDLVNAVWRKCEEMCVCLGFTPEMKDANNPKMYNDLQISTRAMMLSSTSDRSCGRISICRASNYVIVLPHVLVEILKYSIGGWEAREEGGTEGGASNMSISEFASLLSHLKNRCP